MSRVSLFNENDSFARKVGKQAAVNLVASAASMAGFYLGMQAVGAYLDRKNKDALTPSDLTED